MNPKVDKYLIDGCMRCKYGATPQCKVNNWRDELVMLRHLALECGLDEELKWGMPCYTAGNKNIAMVSAFKEYASLSFFKGALLKDPYKILDQHGESSQSARLIKFTSTEQIQEKQHLIQEYLKEAMANEAAGKKVAFQKNPEPVPNELLQVFEEEPELMKAFYALTPGRQRAYIIYISQPKQTKSRLNRIEKCRDKILNGIGLNDHYRSNR